MMKIIENLNKNVVDIILINYSNKFYTRAQKNNTNSAIKLGCFKKVISYQPDDIDELFYQTNQDILVSPRGAGYWLWKPYFIKKTLSLMSDGEYLFYCDSGSLFVNSVADLFKFVKTTNQDIIPFEIQFTESHYTKRDCFILTNTDEIKYHNSKQRLAGFSVWKKTEDVMNFIDEWLSFAQDERIITDKENQMGFPNYDGFIEHRHDQSLFSLLTKKHNLKAFRDPSQYGNTLFDLYPKSKYSQLLFLTRERDVNFFEFLKKKIRPYFSSSLQSFYLKIKTKKFKFI